MRRLALLTLLCASFSTLPACGDDASLPPAADASLPAATTVASLCHHLSTRICAGLGSCGCRFDTRAYDAAGCVEARSQECSASLMAGFGPDVASGAARFDEAAVAGCLAAIDAMAGACDVGTGLAHPLPDACLAFVIANVAVAQPCRLSRGGLAFCGAIGEGVCAPDETHLCTALPGAGAGCLSGLCAPGLVCNGTSCSAPVAAGEACGAPGACASGLVCDATHHCGARVGAGATCEDTSQCQEGLECRGTCQALADLGGACTNELTCGAGRGCTSAPETRTCRSSGGVGDACTADTCGAGLFCGSDGTCAAPPGVDEACPDHRCAPGLTCDDATTTCVALPTSGQTCASGDRFCALGLGCRERDNTCQASAGAGELCLKNPPDYVCGDGLGCFFHMDGTDTCEPLADVGGVCSTFRNCVATTYCDLGSTTCLPRLAAGSACMQGDECAAGLDCRPVGGHFVCAATPAAGEPCYTTCPAELVCAGPGGACAPAFCTLP